MRLDIARPSVCLSGRPFVLYILLYVYMYSKYASVHRFVIESDDSVVPHQGAVHDNVAV